ncbi:EamA family transporter [Treponema parvum]|uniref:EamA family transporter n=1 Tax=Treponema parvum TaxID=138851 RepID=A0A975F0R7_9SPIR|nr:DMT family transporter [Treponema parvum]QTQ12461.1 EamA family transporter [Treponema parvum]QTQ15548.1 EamA family transporter [Treponema parvum]
MLKIGRHPSAALVICALMWSTGGFLIKSVEWNSVAITGARSLIAFIFMCAFLHRKPAFAVYKSGIYGAESLKRPDGKLTLNLWTAAVCYSATMLLFVTATKMTTAANAVLLQYTSLIWVVILSPVLLGEKNSLSDYLSVLGVLAGMVLFFYDGLNGGNFIGNILAVASGAAMAFMSVFMRRQKNVAPEDSFILSHILTFLISLPLFFTGPIKNISVSLPCLFVLGVVQIGIPSILFSTGIKKKSALSAMLISMIEPVMNPIWVIIFVGEIPSLKTVAGGIIILSSVILRSYVRQKRML